MQLPAMTRELACRIQNVLFPLYTPHPGLPFTLICHALRVSNV